MTILKDLLQKADAYRQKIASAGPMPEKESKALDASVCAIFTYSSNALSGSALTLSETKKILEDGIMIEGRSRKDCYEAVGYGAAYYYMLELARRQDMKLTEETIRELHRLFYQKVCIDQAGQYRTVPVGSFAAEQVPPAPEELPRLMGHLADQIHSSKTTLHPIELAAMAHKRLMDMQPFLYGNGRTARLLMNLILVNNGYGAVSIPPARGTDYFNALGDSRRLHDMEPFSRVIAECVIEAEQDYCRCGQKSQSGSSDWLFK